MLDELQRYLDADCAELRLYQDRDTYRDWSYELNAVITAARKGLEPMSDNRPIDYTDNNPQWPVDYAATIDSAAARKGLDTQLATVGGTDRGDVLPANSIPSPTADSLTERLRNDACQGDLLDQAADHIERLEAEHVEDVHSNLKLQAEIERLR